MERMMLKSKIHRAVVTDANVDYEGSVSIAQDLMEAADLKPYEQVQVYNISNGERLTTYVIEAERGSREICLNGAAAHRARKGDFVIIASYAGVDDKVATFHQPRIVYVDHKNRIVKTNAPTRAIA